MDPKRFDEISRSLAAGTSRRRFIKGLSGGILGGTLALIGRGHTGAKSAKVGICHYTGNRNIPVVYQEVSASTAPILLTRGDTLPGTVTDCSSCGDACTSNDVCFTPVCEDGSCGLAPVEPVDCTVSEWSAWSGCSVECGSGERTRTRTIVTDASCGGVECPPLSESEACNGDVCAVICGSAVCTPEGVCLDGECFTTYPHCETGEYGIAANSGGVNVCICDDTAGHICETTSDCPHEYACILNGSGIGNCFYGCSAYGAP